MPFAASAAVIPDDVSNAMQLGFKSSDLPVLEASAATIERHLQTDPENKSLLRSLGILYLDRLQNPAKALPFLQKAAASAPDEAAWQIAYARALRASGQELTAAEFYGKAAALSPREPWPRYEQGNTLAGIGRYAESAAAYRAVLEIEPTNNDARLALAKVLWASGDVPASMKAASEVLAADPANSDARKLVESGASSRRAPAANMSSKGPSRGSPLEEAISKAYKSGKSADFEHAAALTESALERDPSALKLRQSLAYVYLEKLRTPIKALPHLRAISAATPDDTNWMQMYARALANTGDHTGAEAEYRRVAELSPNDVWAMYHQGRALMQLGRNADALAIFRTALGLDPGNVHVQREVARSASKTGDYAEAESIASRLVSSNNRDSDAWVILGDSLQMQQKLTAAGSAYRRALDAKPSDPSALSGIQDIRWKKRPIGKFAFYTFDDTDGLRQTGLFSHVTMTLNGQLGFSAHANERFFKRYSGETIERFETGVGISYRLNRAAQFALGVSGFKTGNLEWETGANAALYLSPHKSVDVSVEYRHSDPINDSYTTAARAMRQNVVSGGINVRPLQNVVLGVSASSARYSDENTRRSVLASVAWHVPMPANPIVKLEYEWLDFSRRTPDYSSPQDYARFRPVIELSPRINDWLTLEFHGELSYVFDEQEWGSGFTIGPRFKRGDSLEINLSYMNYQIPGGQSTWSGDGFKFDLNSRF